MLRVLFLVPLILGFFLTKRYVKPDDFAARATANFIILLGVGAVLFLVHNYPRLLDGSLHSLIPAFISVFLATLAVGVALGKIRFKRPKEPTV